MDPSDVDKTSKDEADTEKLSDEEILERDSDEALKVFRETGEMPEDLDIAVVLLTRQKKMARDNQSAFTKVNQQYIVEKGRNSKLMEHALEVTPKLTQAQQEELEEVKYTDPDKYVELLNKHNASARQAREELINEDLRTQSAEEQIEYRRSLLKTFKDTTGIEITEDVMLNDVPPRITQKLEKGDISFEEYLVEAGRFLTSDIVIEHATSAKTKPKARFSESGGASSVSEKQEAADLMQQYSDGTLDI